MARVYGKEFPERPLMGVVSDLLGIRHFTTSKGSTVRRDFLEAAAEALGIPESTVRALPTKDDVLTAVIEAATTEPMDPNVLSPGATVTNGALQLLIDGIIKNGVAGRPEIPQIEPQWLDEGVAAEFDVERLRDERDRRLMEVAVREGQDHFRTSLLDAYDSRCAVTGFDAVETLEAAHIYPYKGPATNLVTNGLLLRSDIHRLYDRGAIAVHETTLDILVKPHLLVTNYLSLAESRLRLPRRLKNRPATAALRSHREWSGLT